MTIVIIMLLITERKETNKTQRAIQLSSISQGKIAHARNHKGEMSLENATERPLGIPNKIHWESNDSNNI